MLFFLLFFTVFLSSAFPLLSPIGLCAWHFSRFLMRPLMQFSSSNTPNSLIVHHSLRLLIIQSVPSAHTSAVHVAAAPAPLEQRCGRLTFVPPHWWNAASRSPAVRPDGRKSCPRFNGLTQLLSARALGNGTLALPAACIHVTWNIQEVA